jgi:hypothetical protein
MYSSVMLKSLLHNLLKQKKQKMSYRRHISGSGILEKTLYKTPYEFHIPGYQFCGPNTKLEEPLRRGDVGINGLDLACNSTLHTEVESVSFLSRAKIVYQGVAEVN